jgi:hypothetical protein
MEVVSRALANLIEEAREKCGDNPFKMYSYMQEAESPYVGYENYSYIIRAIEDGYVVRGETYKHTSEDVYDARWKKYIENEDGTVNMEKLKNELTDYLQLLENVPQVYDELAGMSKPFTDPKYIIKRVHERFIDRQIAYDDLMMIGDEIADERNGGDVIVFTKEELQNYFDVEEEE